MSETPGATEEAPTTFEHEDNEYDPGIDDDPDFDLDEVDEDVTESEDD